MPISQLVVGGNSCGACAASYALEELANHILSQTDIEDLWKAIQFNSDPSKKGQVMVTIGPFKAYWEHTDPTRLNAELNNGKNVGNKLKSTPYRDKKSPLQGIDKLLSDSKAIQAGEGMDLIKADSKLRAIGIYVTSAGLHYILTKYEKGSFLIQDSNGAKPAYENAGNIQAGIPFTANLNSGTETYTYLGACLVVSK